MTPVEWFLQCNTCWVMQSLRRLDDLRQVKRPVSHEQLQVGPVQVEFRKSWVCLLILQHGDLFTQSDSMDSRNVFSAKAPENRLLWNILWWLGGHLFASAWKQKFVSCMSVAFCFYIFALLSSFSCCYLACKKNFRPKTCELNRLMKWNRGMWHVSLNKSFLEASLCVKGRPPQAIYLGTSSLPGQTLSKMIVCQIECLECWELGSWW